MTSLRIGIICNEYPPDAFGGIGVFAESLAEGLAKLGHKVFVIGFSSHTGARIQNGVEIEGLAFDCDSKSPRSTEIRRRWFLSRRVREWIERVKPDIVESYDWKGYTAFLNIPGKLKCPVVIRLEGSTAAYALMNDRKCSFLTKYFERRALKGADFRIAATKYIDVYTSKSLPGIPKSDAVIPNFIDSELFEPVPGIQQNPNRILYVGRISRNKGVHHLFAALPKVLKQFPDAELQLIGADTEEGTDGASYLDELMTTLPEKHRGRVDFQGWTERTKLPALYTSARLAVFPSVAEAFGIVALEAMACGLPVIAPTESCFAEFIEHGKTGLLVDLQKPTAISDAILDLLKNPDEANRIGRNARQKVLEEFSTDVVLQKNVDFYRSCIAK